MPVLVRLDDVDGRAAARSLPAVDRHGQVQAVARELADAALEALALRATRRIAALRLVAGFGNGENGVHHRLLHDLDDTGEGASSILPRARVPFMRPARSPAGTGGAKGGSRTHEEIRCRRPRHIAGKASGAGRAA